MNFAEKIRYLRKEKKMSQTTLANAVGVTLRTIQSYEGGKSYPKQRDTYKKLAEVLGCDTNYLMTEDSSFVTDAAHQYGSRGAKQAADLISEISGLFAGGELAEEDKDEMMEAIQEAYWIAKMNNKKFTPKKFRKDTEDTEA